MFGTQAPQAKGGCSCCGSCTGPACGCCSSCSWAASSWAIST